MRLLIILLTFLFSSQAYSACSTYQYNVVFSYFGPQQQFFFGSPNSFKTLSDANAGLAPYDISCTGNNNSLVLSGCRYISTNAAVSSNAQMSYYGPSTQCFESAENERSCDRKGNNGGGMILESTAPLMCNGECEVTKVGSSTPIFGHSTGTGLQSVYAYTGEICPSPPHPKVDAPNETGAGESCDIIDGIKFCSVPDIDGDGSPDVPTPEDSEGCMSVTNQATGAHNVSCNSQFPDGGIDSDKVCGYVDTEFKCVNKDQCQFVNGNTVCIDDVGNYVGTDNPDNPMNGGNLDGDKSNDIVGPNEQINSPLLTDDQLINNNNVAQQLTDDLSPLLNNIDNSVKTNGEKIDGSNVLLTAIASGISDLNSSGGSIGNNGDIIEDSNPNSPDQYVSGNEFDSIDFDSYIGDPEATMGLGNTFGDTFDLDSQLNNLLPNVSGCSDLRIQVKGITMLNLSCESMSSIRALLSWIVYFMLVLHIFRTITMERK
jgi:hypothetical protein